MIQITMITGVILHDIYKHNFCTDFLILNYQSFVSHVQLPPSPSPFWVRQSLMEPSLVNEQTTGCIREVAAGKGGILSQFVPQNSGRTKGWHLVRVTI